MAVDLVGSVASSQATSVNQPGLGQEDFLKILLTQLTYQDPMKPLDNQQFIAQMAQFSALEQARQLNEKVDALLVAQAATQSFGLVGKIVQYSQDGGAPVDAKVDGVSFANGQPLLTLNVGGNELVKGIPLSSIVTVTNLTTLPTPGSGVNP